MNTPLSAPKMSALSADIAAVFGSACTDTDADSVGLADSVAERVEKRLPPDISGDSDAAALVLTLELTLALRLPRALVLALALIRADRVTEDDALVVNVATTDLLRAAVPVALDDLVDDGDALAVVVIVACGEVPTVLVAVAVPVAVFVAVTVRAVVPVGVVLAATSAVDVTDGRVVSVNENVADDVTILLVGLAEFDTDADAVVDASDDALKEGLPVPLPLAALPPTPPIDAVEHADAERELLPLAVRVGARRVPDGETDTDTDHELDAFGDVETEGLIEDDGLCVALSAIVGVIEMDGEALAAGESDDEVDRDPERVRAEFAERVARIVPPDASADTDAAPDAAADSDVDDVADELGVALVLLESDSDVDDDFVDDALADTVLDDDADSEMGDVDADFVDDDVAVVVADVDTVRVLKICVADLSAVRDTVRLALERVAAAETHADAVRHDGDAVRVRGVSLGEQDDEMEPLALVDPDVDGVPEPLGVVDAEELVVRDLMAVGETERVRTDETVWVMVANTE